MKIHAYVVVHDGGSAPNHEAPATTLAICKPRIRRSANVGDVVIGFSGSRLGPEPHSVRWAGIVSEKLSFAEYWNDLRFARKKPGRSATPDNIYKPFGRSVRLVPNQIHAEGNVATDLAGEFVLVFDEAWRFGAAAPILPERFELRLVGSRRGHRVVEVRGDDWRELRRWLDCRQRETSVARRGCGKDARPSKGRLRPRC